MQAKVIWTIGGKCIGNSQSIHILFKRTVHPKKKKRELCHHLLTLKSLQTDSPVECKMSYLDECSHYSLYTMKAYTRAVQKAQD